MIFTEYLVFYQVNKAGSNLESVLFFISSTKNEEIKQMLSFT